MPDFVYKAIDSQGRIIESDFVAPTEGDVIKHLQKINLIPVNIKQQKAKIKGIKSKKKVKIKDVILFTKQLSTLLKSGVPILVSLNAIKEQNEDPMFIDLIDQVIKQVNQGNSLSSALAQYPKIFPSLYVNSIKIGELSGTLEDTLEYLRKYLEEEEQLRRSVKKAFRYPTLVIVGIIAAFVVFMTVVIPSFIPIFSASGMELPLPTRILISTSDLFSNYGLIILFAVVGVITALAFYKRTEKGKFHYDKFLLEVPIFGPLLKKVSNSRFAKIFYTMNRTGIPVVQAFETLASNMDNEVYRKELIQILERIKEGDGIAKSLSHSPYFASFVVEMIAIGEKSGALDDMLQSISEFYDLEVNETVNNMTALIEPIVTVALGGMVLLLAMAIFLPMWDMMSIAQ